MLASAAADEWRRANIGRLLNNAVRRFESRVLELMTEAGYRDPRISHLNLTRNLDREGARITALAARAGMTKQAMGELVQQCMAMGLVETAEDPADKRARIVHFTRKGLEWLDAFRSAVDQAEQEMVSDIGSVAVDRLKSALRAYDQGSGADEQ